MGEEPDFLAAIGHGHHDIQEALDYFKHKEILTGVSEFVDLPKEYFINRHFVDSYVYLSGCLGYLDNMAMVTPVSNEARECISNTTGSTLFKERKLSTLAFLDEIRRVEARFLGQLSSRGRLSLTRYVGQRKLPSVYLTLLHQYALSDHEQRKKAIVADLLTEPEWEELTDRLDRINRSSSVFFQDHQPWEPQRRSLEEA